MIRRSQQILSRLGFRQLLFQAVVGEDELGDAFLVFCLRPGFHLRKLPLQAVYLLLPKKKNSTN